MHFHGLEHMLKAGRSGQPDQIKWHEIAATSCGGWRRFLEMLLSQLDEDWWTVARSHDGNVLVVFTGHEAQTIPLSRLGLPGPGIGDRRR